MKLELKHIVPYLPYGVRCEILNYKCDYVGMQFSALNGYYMLAGIPHFTYDGGSVGKSFSDFKPILRPLSDLAKEIKIDGKTFVPLIEIGKIFFRNIAKFDDIDGVSYVGYTDSYYGEQEDNQFGFYQKDMVFGVWKDIRYETESPVYQYGGYNEIAHLFEWKFDVFNLIDNNLAIDMNTVKP